MEDYRLKIESLTISLAYDMGVMISEAQKEARKDERKKVLRVVEKLALDIYDGSDWHTGRHALVDELRAKLNQLKED